MTASDSDTPNSVPLRFSDRIRWGLDALSRHKALLVLAILLGSGAALLRATVVAKQAYVSTAFLKVERNFARSDARSYETSF